MQRRLDLNIKTYNMNHPIHLHRKLYRLFKSTGSFDNRHDTVNSYTNGRTDNSSDMTTEEILVLINKLESYQKHIGGNSNDFQKGDIMRKRILSLFHQYGYTEYSYEKRRMVVDFDRLDGWMLKFGYLHKKLNKYKYAELPKLICQVEQLVTKYIQKV